MIVSSKQITWISQFLDETAADLAVKVPAAAGGQAQKQENWYFPFKDVSLKSRSTKWEQEIQTDQDKHLKTHSPPSSIRTFSQITVYTPLGRSIVNARRYG